MNKTSSAFNWTVITVVLNGQRTISQCLASVKLQTVNVVHVFQDGLSTDGTVDAICSEKEDSGYRVDFRSESDSGIYCAMNRGLARSTTAFTAILNADDYFHDNNTLLRVEQIFDENPDVDVVCCNIRYVENEKEVRRTDLKHGIFTLRRLLQGEQLPHPGMFVRTGVYDGLTFDEAKKISSDYKFQLQLLCTKKAKIIIADFVGVTQRVGGASQSGIKAFIIGKLEIFDALREVLGLGVYSAIIVILRTVVTKTSQINWSRQ